MMATVQIIILCFLTGSIYTEVRSRDFLRQTDPLVSLQTFGQVFYTLSLSSCASRCLDSSSCAGFYFLNSTGYCGLGRWLVPVQQQVAAPPPGGVLYSYGALCNSSNGFRVISSGDVSVCVYISTWLKNYTDARKDCQARKAQLYTPKNGDKLNIFLTLGKTYNQSMWCGANDIASENVFKWEDDGTIITQTWRSTMFEPGQPSNSNNNQDCVTYFPVYTLLDDENCANLAMFVCEID